MSNPNEFTDAQQQPADTSPIGRNSQPEVNYITKLPPFWPQKPAVWFAQVEGQFTLARIKVDETKYCHVISHLEPQYADVVEDIITSPPSTGKYDKLKAELIKRLSDSKEKKVKQLLIHEELGERKPSEFLRHLQHLAGNDVPEEFLRTIWSNRLPMSTQTIIAAQAGASLMVLADLADRIHDVVPPRMQVAEASLISEHAIERMSSQIAALTKQVEELTVESRRSRSRERSLDRQQRSRRRSASSRSQSMYRKNPICWYHARFGSRANRCIRPCDYKPSESKNAWGNQ